MNDDSQFFMRKRERLMQDTSNKVSSQSRIQNLRDDPLAAAHSTRYQSLGFRLQRFQKNIEQVRGHNQLAEGYIHHAVDIMQRVRELAVQMATSTYTAEEREYASYEVDQLLNELIESANAKDGEGASMFAGTRTRELPFRPVMGILANGERERIVGVEYLGNIMGQKVEVNEGTVIESNIPGNQIFWAKNDRMVSLIDRRGYQAAAAGSFRVDNAIIQVEEGDTLPVIVQKINDSPAAVRARIGQPEGGIILESTTSHQMWLEDIGDSSILQDLGLVNTTGLPPYNISQDVIYTPGSLFDVVFQFRNSLLGNDQDTIGSQVLGNIDEGMDSLISNMARYGALDARLELLYKKINNEELEVQQLDAGARGVDYAQMVTELRMLEYAHEAALATTARVLQTSLLNYIR